MAGQGGNRVPQSEENYRPAGWRKKQMEINKNLEGKKITKADVGGYGIELRFDDGTTFYYDATDGGYSTYELAESEE